MDRIAGLSVCRLGQQNLYGWSGLFLITLCFCVFGCTGPLSEQTTNLLSASATTETITIALGEVDITAEGLKVAISGSQPFSYRLVNHHEPLQLTIEVPQARIKQPEERKVGHGGIKTVRLSQVDGSETLARLEIELADGASYRVSKAQTQLAVLVQTPDAPAQPQAVALKPAVAAAMKTWSEAMPKATLAQEYKIGMGDMLAVAVYDEPDLTLQRRVTARGLIDFPLIGQVQVAGLTAAQVAERLEGRLSPGYLRYPQVFVDIVEFASKKIFIVGAIAKPTALTLRGETSLLEVLSQTESLSHSNSLTVFRRISLAERQGNNRSDVEAIHVDLNELLRRGNMSKNIMLQAQDVVYIPKPDAVFVFGEVATTGPVPVPEGGMTLVEAINKAGGFSNFAASKRTRVLRMVDGREKVIHVDMAAVIRGDLSKDIMLRSNDIVIVPESVF
jgi:polysaccharide export outer membrane protein